MVCVFMCLGAWLAWMRCQLKLPKNFELRNWKGKPLVGMH